MNDRLRFYLSTWTGRILLINGIIFLLITVTSQSLWSPQSQYLIAWGAKDPVSIAKGEWWRFITPIFLHFGIIHFALNSLALKVIGSYLEPILGGLWFLLIYLGSGLGGNVLSSLMNVSVGAGASGAIFGLIGVGMLIEQILMRREGVKRPMGPFTYMALLNILIAIGFNFVFTYIVGARIGIDNSAHLGGLFSGMILGFSMLFLKKNRLFSQKRILGICILGLFTSLIVGGAYLPLRTPRIYQQFLSDAEQSTEPLREYYFYNQALMIQSTDPLIRFKRGRSLVILGDLHYAMRDLLYCIQFSNLEHEFILLHAELIQAERYEDAKQIQILLERIQKKNNKI